MPVTRSKLQVKALRFFRLLEGDDSELTASKGWLDRYKKRFGIRQINISGEALSADKEAVHLFKGYLAELNEQEEISRKQLRNCHENGLNYNMLPTKTLA